MVNVMSSRPGSDVGDFDSEGPTVAMRPMVAPKQERPTARTELAKLERSLFDAFEAAQLQQFER